MQDKPHRLLWLDIVKGLCMMLIIAVHIGCTPQGTALIMPVCLCGFFFSAGFTFNEQHSWARFMLKKTLALLVPVGFFGILNASVSGLWFGNNIPERFAGIILQIPGEYDDMWFVACLFIMEMIFKGICTVSEKPSVRCVLSVMLFIVAVAWIEKTGQALPWHIVNAFFFMPFMFAGYVVKKKDLISRLSTFVGNRRVNVGICAMLSAVIYIVTVLSLDNCRIDAHLLQYGSMSDYVICSVLGIPMIVSVSIYIAGYGSRLLRKAIGYIGRNTLIYYGLQSKFISIFLFMITLLNIHCGGILFAPVVTIFLVAALAPAAYLIREFAPFMIGKGYEKRLLYLFRL